MQIGSVHFVIALVAGWLQREQVAALAYLKEENKVLREHLGDKRLRFTDAQRCRLARRGTPLGGCGLRELGCIVSPDTILRWYRQLVAQKYDGSSRRGPERPRTPGELAALVVSLALENPSWGYTRNLLDAEEGLLLGKTHLIMDRDPVFTKGVRDLFREAGVEPVRLPARSPNLNAFAERFVLSIKSECLNKLILLGEGHLRLAVREYVTHYNRERPHQGLGGASVVPPANENTSGPIECEERLGGLLRFYRRKAA